MKIDLHVHTSEFSPDSALSPERAVQVAIDIGLDGICFTEHDRAWAEDMTGKLSEKYTFPVFRGVEYMIREGGEILVFGLNRTFPSIIDIVTLRRLCLESGGFMIAAHPFRGFPSNTVNDFDAATELVLKRPVFDKVDAIEGFNGHNIDSNNEFACRLAERLGMRYSGGSDAHAENELGKCVTIFDHDFRTEAELIAQLKAGRFTGSVNKTRT